MNETVDPGMILEFLLKSLGVFTVIFLIAVLTPWMAKHVDSWIADYKKSHGRKKSSEDPRLYAVRSIYELPMEKPENSQEISEKLSESKSKKAVVIKKRKENN